ncbi:alpha/beta hydrolase [Siphonobacter sp. SORGH_AS_1065]|uniref:RBBP9/YdeN family alpha/beta hydrolase n=1 Tax=Siphonobacter sp. SORGH_AS_1065 TaxID=3041795 RepID=UPI00277F7B53|nr:alpha/beta hydrolase [Siphonobacter sp. SORGH_AS_1065]MDQ1089161.1 putative alpha/beta hydrolase family esterase [Siphonobacter sp. SORGH_AS_1065]
MPFQSKVMILPGLGNSGEGHWQTLWQKQYGFRRIEQENWDTPERTDWVEVLDEMVFKAGSSEVLLVGHSLACVTIAYWAEKYKRPIKGALLVAPSDTEAATYPEGTTGFAPMPLSALPFPSLVVASTNDYYVTPKRAQLFADSWGSELVWLPDAEHINVASGYGPWPDGIELLKKLSGLSMK